MTFTKSARVERSRRGETFLSSLTTASSLSLRFVVSGSSKISVVLDESFECVAIVATCANNT